MNSKAGVVSTVAPGLILGPAEYLPGTRIAHMTFCNTGGSTRVLNVSKYSAGSDSTALISPKDLSLSPGDMAEWVDEVELARNDEIRAVVNSGSDVEYQITFIYR